MKTVQLKKMLQFLIFISTSISIAQADYQPNTNFPYGRLNPDAPEETGQFQELMGICDCISTQRKSDQTWAKSQKMTWTFKYIMNGTAVQDETIKEDGNHSGSIRQFKADSSKWYVHWYSSASPTSTFPVWSGSKRGDSIVLYNSQKAPNGTDGYFRISFKDISEAGFNWIGEWVNLSETFSFPTWKIKCTKREED